MIFCLEIAYGVPFPILDVPGKRIEEMIIIPFGLFRRTMTNFLKGIHRCVEANDDLFERNRLEFVSVQQINRVEVLWQ